MCRLAEEGVRIAITGRFQGFQSDVWGLYAQQCSRLGWGGHPSGGNVRRGSWGTAGIQAADPKPRSPRSPRRGMVQPQPGLEEQS